MLLERSRFHASSWLTAGCSVTNSSKTAALSFQTEYNWKQKILLGAVLPGLIGIGGSLLSLICACAYVCTLALTPTQEQTCLSEVAANPGRGSENSSPSWERSLGGMLQKKTQSDFPWCGWRDKHLPSVWLWVWGDEQKRKKPQLSFHFPDVYALSFFPVTLTTFWGTLGTLSHHGQREQHLGPPGGSGGFSASCCTALLTILAPAPNICVQRQGQTQPPPGSMWCICTCGAIASLHFRNSFSATASLIVQVLNTTFYPVLLKIDVMRTEHIFSRLYLLSHFHGLSRD